MTSEADRSALRRKTSAHKSAAAPTAMDTAKAVRFSMARAGDLVLDVALGVRDVVEDTLLPDELPDGLPESPLFLQMKDELTGIGAAIICPQAIGAVIEAQTIGTILPMEADNRKPTRTDAALVSAFLDQFLRGFGELAHACHERPPVDGFQTAGALEDARATQMVLHDETLRRYKITVDFGLGAKVGTIILIFPHERRKTPMAVKNAQDWSESLEKAVMGTSARLQAVLCTMTVPLADITALSVGDLLPLKGASLTGVSMIGSSGKQVLRAQLGRSGPVRAVRLRMSDEEDSAPVGLEALAARVASDMGAVRSLPPTTGAELGETLGAIDLNAEPMGQDAQMAPSLGDIEMETAMPGEGGATLGAIEPIQIPESEVIQG